MNTLIKKTVAFTLLLSLLISITQADDTEIYFSSEVSRVNPNVLFVLDVSGSMDVNVEGSGNSEIEVRTLSRTISSGNDDVEQDENGHMSRSSSDLELTKEADQQTIGLRFRDISIPKGAKINSAYIQFQTDEVSNTTSGNIIITGEKVTDASSFSSSDNDVTNRTKTSHQVHWSPPAWDTVGERGSKQRTPNLKNIVNEITQQLGWEASNSMVFIIDKDNASTLRRTAESYNGSTSGAAQLIIEYEGVAPDKNRLQIMQSALRTVLDNAPTNLNVGLMNYGEIKYSDNQLGVKFPVKNIEDLAYPIVSESLPLNGTDIEWWRSNIHEPTDIVTVRTYLSEITDWFWKDNWHETSPDEMDHYGATPIVEALYEAALYFRGGKLGWGQNEPGASWDSGRAASHPATYEGNAIDYDNATCNSINTKSHWGPINFDGNNYSGMRCPADANNPSGLGTYANCAGTESCQMRERCDWHCPNNNYSAPDETGHRSCNVSYTKTNCRNELKCYYKRCNGGFTAHPNYISPIKQSCQRNFIVLLSDGKPEYSRRWDDNWDEENGGVHSKGPTYWKLADGDWSGLEDKTDSSTKFDHTSCADNLTPFGYASGACGSELTKFLSEQDQSPMDGLQAIDTYAIGFGLGAEANASDYLQSLVTTSDGYFEADDEANLATAFGNILSIVGATTSAYASPGYTVNMKNTTENDEFIYIPVFDKRLAPKWSGNLKKFKLVSSTDAQGRGLRKIQGKNNLDAVDDLGAFTEEAIDYWSSSDNNNPDGYYVTKGGTANLLNPDTRKLYSDLECATYPCSLTAEINEIKESNAESDKPITNTLLTINPDKDENYRKKLIKFIRGYESDGSTARKHMGDVLHSMPIIQTYQNADDDGNGQEQYVFVATNEGYLHVFDTTSGIEKFAFMPKELFKNIETQYLDTDKGGHRYGIDGQLGIWHDDLDNNKEVNGEEKVYLYFGMRRGGRSYYALDITNINEPRVQWKIDGATDSAYTNLGHTWSKPYLAGVRQLTNSNPEDTNEKAIKKVMIVTGGYDNNQDNEDQITTNIAANIGNDIFIINAKNGNRLWSLKSSNVDGAENLEHSIPGGIRVLDLNRNGAIDRMYFADTGGNIWRLDLNEELNETDANNKSKLIKLASLGGTGVQARKFYNEPDVAMFKHQGRSVLALSIGSGYRSHPMNRDLTDHFFTLLDKATFKPINTDTFSTIQLSDLAKVTLSVDEEGAKSLNYGALNETNLLATDKRGWYLDFSSLGEKVLADAITVDGVVSFTTFVPQANASSVNTAEDLCTAPATQGRLYSMNLLTGKPKYDLNWSGGEPNIDDIFVAVSADEIPGAPQRVFNAFKCTDGACEHAVDIRVGKKLLQASSYDRGYLEPVYWTDPDHKTTSD